MSFPPGRYFAALLPRLAACAALCAALCAPARAYYYEPPPLPQPFSIFKFKVTHWQTTGSDYFRTSFYLPPESWVPPDPDVQAGSTLDFQGLDSAIEVLSAEARLFRGFSVEAEYGSSSFSGGTAYDHDWLHAPWHILYFYTGPVWVDPIHRDFSLSRSRLAGSTELYSFNAYLRVYNSSRQRFMRDSDYEHNIDLYAGYSWYGDSIRISEGNQLQSVDVFGGGTQPLGPFSGLHSTYKLHWQGVRFGFREQTKFTDALTMEGKLAYSPNMEYLGEGYWNLRSEFFNPSFRHTAKGTIMEFSASLEWKLTASLLLNAGYRGTFYAANDGVDRTFFSDGTQSGIKLEKVRNSRTGWLLGLALKY